MCGLIAAFTDAPFPETAARKALDLMARRGPDGEGEWRSEGVYLGHRRLAIIDLDARASQPMHSACGRYVIAFNGEIYNHAALRRDLEAIGVHFRTRSDTEVILALFARDGEAMLPKLQGMFAFVIWDWQEKRAFIARDPYGIKPLYLATVEGGVLVASQVKALRATGLVSDAPDLMGQAGFWMLGSVPEPHSWYRDVSALSAGHCVWIEKGRAAASHCWHDLGQAWRESGPAEYADAEVRDQVRRAVRESVGRHLVADVPVGIFLSGGIDSASLAGLMAEAGAQGLIGVTVAYDEFTGSPEDEAPDAARIARHYGFEHYVRRVTEEEFHADLPRILAAMDQPSIDGINTWYASKAAAELGLKVVISGIGGDELFQGYSSFKTLPRLVAWWGRVSRVPGVRALAAAAAGIQSRRSRNMRWKYAPRWAETVAGAWWLRRSVCAPGDLPGLMPGDWADQLSQGFCPEAWVKAMAGEVAVDPVLAIGQIESMSYLRNQLLRDSDWASMDHGIELRTPLVDATLLRNLQPILPAFSRLSAKALLALAPEKPLPHDLIHRSKTGFSIPVNKWVARLPGDPAMGGQRKWMDALVRAYASACR